MSNEIQINILNEVKIAIDTLKEHYDFIDEWTYQELKEVINAVEEYYRGLI